MTRVNSVIENRFGKELTVVLEEDHGYREFFWFPRMSLDNLVEWWSSQPAITRHIGLDRPYSLPGDVYMVETAAQYDLWWSGFRNEICCKAWLGTEFDSCLITPKKELIVDQGFPPECLEDRRKRLFNYLN